MAWMRPTPLSVTKARVAAVANEVKKDKIMEWLSENWVWVLFGGGFIAMHMFGHGGHGRGGHREEEKPAGKDGKPRPSKQGSDHQH